MCGRFALTHTAREAEELFGVEDLDIGLAPRWNIAPSQPILMVAAGHRARRQGVLVRWGLLPGWVKDVKAFPLLFNARSESAAEKSSFRAAMRHRRTLVPASGFYEWRRVGDRRTQPYWIRPRHGGLIAFAGLMETYLDPGGAEMDTGAILTVAANATLAPIHERMPVVIGEADFDRWLDCVGQEPRDVAGLLRSADDDFFEAIPVGAHVNRAANEGSALQERVPEADAGRQPAQLDLF